MASETVALRYVPGQKWKGSAHWLSTLPPSYEQACIIRLIWDTDLSPPNASRFFTTKLWAFRLCFSNMTLRERINSGDRCIMFAGIDCAMASAANAKAAMGFVQEVKSGMHAYAMSIGDAPMLLEYVTIVNAYSSLQSYYTLPPRHLFHTDAEWDDHLKHLLENKRKCLKIVWDTLSKQFHNNVLLEKWARLQLYFKMPRTAHPTLVDHLSSIVPPNGYEALMITAVKNIAVNNLWLASLRWDSNLAPSFISDYPVITALCEKSRADVLRWMLSTKIRQLVGLHGIILRVIARTDAKLAQYVLTTCLPRVVQPRNIRENLIIGACQNPDNECLKIITDLEIYPPDTVECLGGTSTLSLCGKHSHMTYLNYMTSTLKFKFHVSQLKDFLALADVKCLSMYLQMCGEDILKDMRLHPEKLPNILSKFHGTFEAHKYMVDFLMTNLLHKSEKVKLIRALQSMCLNIFKQLPQYVVAHSVESVIDQMKYVAMMYESIRMEVIKTTINILPLKQKLEEDPCLLCNLPRSNASLEIFKYFFKDLKLHPKHFILTLRNCLQCRNLLEYANENMNPPMLVLCEMDFSTLFQHEPREVINCKGMIATRELPKRVLLNYVTMQAKTFTHNLSNVIASGIICRCIQNTDMATVALNVDELPPPEI